MLMISLARQIQKSVQEKVLFQNPFLPDVPYRYSKDNNNSEIADHEK